MDETNLYSNKWPYTKANLIDLSDLVTLYETRMDETNLYSNKCSYTINITNINVTGLKEEKWFLPPSINPTRNTNFSV